MDAETVLDAQKEAAAAATSTGFDARTVGDRRPLEWRAGARWASVLGLVAADVLAWGLSAGIIYAIRTLIWGSIPLFWALYACGISWILLRFGVGLYPAVGVSQPEELRRSVRSTTVAALIHLGMLVALGEYQPWRTMGLGVWLLVVPIAYFCRGTAKRLLIRHRLFGHPYVVVGTGEKGSRAVKEMLGNPELGLVPVAAFADEAQLHEGHLRGVPVLGSIDDAGRYPFPYPVHHAVVAVGGNEASADRLSELTARLAKRYLSVRIFADLTGSSNLWVQPYPLGPYVALEIPSARLSAAQRFIKRAFDLIAIVPVFLVTVPVVAIAAFLVKVLSPGPAFFSQEREGLDGKPIRIWKLRTMVLDAEHRLTEHLAEDVRVRFEWERTFKLRHDPRVIPKIGSFLRRASIDELPQLWNVVKGEMSLVGPRIMPRKEVERYSEAGRELRRGVPPGMTGLWQVMYRNNSGNNSDLGIREVADSYYVNNWSVWLDAWILLRTVRVVLTDVAAPDVIGLKGAGTSPEAPEGRRASILLAEDLPVNQLFATAILKNGGYDVDVVGDGAEAVQAVQRGEYDLVLMDVQMPVLDGVEATRRIRSLGGGKASDIPILALTANSLPEEVARCRAAGMNAHVAKPIDGDALLGAVARWLGQKEAGGASEIVAGLPGTGEVVLDEEHITRLARLLEPAEFDEIVGKFEAELPKHLNAITAAGADRARVEWEAHALISLSGNLGLVELSSCSRRLRDASRAGGGEDVGPLVHALGVAAERALASLRRRP